MLLQISDVPINNAQYSFIVLAIDDFFTQLARKARKLCSF
jgi:hypothetical protein